MLKFAYACVCFFVGNIVTLSRTCFQTCVGEERHCDWREHVPAFASGSWRDPAHLPNVVGWHWNIYLQGDLGGWQWLSQRPPPSQVCIFTQCHPSLIVLFLVGFFPLCFFFSFTCNQDMMDGCFLHCCGLSLLSSLIHQTPRIFTMPRSHSNCSALLFSAFLSDSISLITCSLSPTFTRTGSYLMLQKTQ